MRWFDSGHSGVWGTVGEKVCRINGVFWCWQYASELLQSRTKWLPLLPTWLWWECLFSVCAGLKIYIKEDLVFRVPTSGSPHPTFLTWGIPLYQFSAFFLGACSPGPLGEQLLCDKRFHNFFFFFPESKVIVLETPSPLLANKQTATNDTRTKKWSPLSLGSAGLPGGSAVHTFLGLLTTILLYHLNFRGGRYHTLTLKGTGGSRINSFSVLLESQRNCNGNSALWIMPTTSSKHRDPPANFCPPGGPGPA